MDTIITTGLLKCATAATVDDLNKLLLLIPATYIYSIIPFHSGILLIYREATDPFIKP